jgi:pyrroline-5-carboxylate reductase
MQFQISCDARNQALGQPYELRHNVATPANYTAQGLGVSNSMRRRHLASI